MVKRDSSGAFRGNGAGGFVAPRERVHVSVSPHTGGGRRRAGQAAGKEYDDSAPVTAAGVAAIVREILAEADFYILESEVADAQASALDVAEQTWF